MATKTICSTHVEMFPPRHDSCQQQGHLLHACGDVSAMLGAGSSLLQSAPRMWRCFIRRVQGRRLNPICSTHVEMFLRPCPRLVQGLDLLHACGDVSDVLGGIGFVSQSAPRMWRCFSPYLAVSLLEGICSTHVEMFPRMWRCFRPGAQGDERASICSTHVEMFLRRTPHMAYRKHLLHACGDVSDSPDIHDDFITSAPRMWRCFYRGRHFGRVHAICSTHVEMLPRPKRVPMPTSHLLHACGDVSVPKPN